MTVQVGATARSMDVFGRSPNTTEPESKYEKLMVLPKREDQDPSNHAWADARFTADILAEHALFFALLMPEEVAARERTQALRFMQSFTALFEEIDGSKPPERSGLKKFVGRINEEIKPFIEYKARLGEAQRGAASTASSGRSSSITPATRQSAGSAVSTAWRTASPSSTGRRSSRSGRTSWTSTPASSLICSTPTSSS